jgi:hypothetical protein
MAAHSISFLMHLAIMFTSSSMVQAEAQKLQELAQSRHASMQDV